MPGRDSCTLERREVKICIAEKRGGAARTQINLSCRRLAASSADLS